ncbi:heme ABC exporter, ATP-binding protein CcmA [Saccharospirillum sp. MSK14-1]|uniref:cytochrome c biogenesis heme-transporting ATPase CcmA n=1 Tax=Saccharospirillum sp. MSK14-1 TaxID=1897632 RepID=UPI000D39D139|nr:cytochrome c biogenesis heme-transporting ATPase CcmA [Saccharospirillum sp. MSK14-1]PTY37297.1 heme ABC exporter, ATP-binding protein CcmA [Saccharospirillum sp. MSK14-1]
MTPVLSAQSLRCERDERLLFDRLDLSLMPGDILHLTGPNGSGKTTLLRALVGLGQAVEGHIQWFDGQVQSNEKIWYIGHRPGVTLLQSPLENLRYALALRGLERNESSLFEALEHVGLRGYEDVPSRQLSAGQQRRVALARLFLDTPSISVWVLDEPLTALDDKAVELLKARIQAFAAAGGSVLMTSHHGMSGDAVRTLALGGAE